MPITSLMLISFGGVSVPSVRFIFVVLGIGSALGNDRDRQARQPAVNPVITVDLPVVLAVDGRHRLAAECTLGRDRGGHVGGLLEHGDIDRLGQRLLDLGQRLQGPLVAAVGVLKLLLVQLADLRSVGLGMLGTPKSMVLGLQPARGNPFGSELFQAAGLPRPGFSSFPRRRGWSIP